ncbi:MAG: AI-2E family transporter [Bacteroidales bacterium]|nr:AI-2E family transporter [Bacteroidales bacterium]
MNQSAGTLQRFAYFLIITVITGYVLVIGKFIIVPIVFAALLSIMVQPISNFLERYIRWKVPAILLTFLAVLIPVSGIIMFFSYQLGDVIQNMPAITDNLKHTTDLVFAWLEDQFGITRAQSWDWLRSNFSKILDSPLQFFKGGLSSGTAFLLNFFMVLIFMFFFLLYRGAIKNFILLQFKPANRQQGREILYQIQYLVRHYLYGLLMVILILAILNSIGLLIIGVGYAVFWASLAAFLSIIPYIGTTLGGLLPFMYSFATATNWWQPLAVVALYFSVQQVEGNLITPYVVGSNVKINPFIAIISLLIGGVIWGLAGIVLGIPIAAIVKLIFDHVDALKPLGALMSRDLHEKEDIFLKEWDDERHRITGFFKDRQKSE